MTSDGVEVDLAAARAVSVTVERGIGIADHVRVEVALPYEARDLSTHPAFSPGRRLGVSAAWDDAPLELLGLGEIVRLSPRYPQRGPILVEVTAMDPRHRLTLGTDSRNWARGTSAGVILGDVLRSHGIEPRDLPDEGVPAGVVTKGVGETDAALVRALSAQVDRDLLIGWDEGWVAEWRRINERVRVRERMVTATRPGLDARLYRWRKTPGDLLSFSPSVMGDVAATDVQVFYYDVGAKVWRELVWPDPEARRRRRRARRPRPPRDPGWRGDDTKLAEDLAAVSTGMGARGLRIGFGAGTVEVHRPRGITNAEEAKAFAVAWVRANAQRVMKAEALILGDPEIAPRSLVEVDGVGDAWRGEWMVSTLSHELRRGRGAPWTTRLTLTRVRD